MARAIFIGYRRDDTADVVGRVNDALVGAFGESQVFRDVDSIPMGADFAAHIRATLARCRVFLAFIGPDWLDARDEHGKRRIDDPRDLVRIELETALETPKLLVVPILVNGARMPSPETLPVTLRDLASLNAGWMRRDPDFRTDMGRLVDALRTHMRTGRLDLRALGGAATRAAGLSAGVVAAWVALAGVVAVSAGVPQVREAVVDAGIDLVASVQPQADDQSNGSELQVVASVEPNQQAAALPSPVEEQLAQPQSQHSGMFANTTTPTDRHRDPIVGSWTQGTVTLTFREDGSLVGALGAEFSQGQSVPRSIGSWQRRGSFVIAQLRIVNSGGDEYVAQLDCSENDAVMECAGVYISSSSCELLEGGRRLYCPNTGHSATANAFTMVRD